MDRDTTHSQTPSGGAAAVAMSGGVDSSVAAYLTKSEGYKTVGVMMKLQNEGDNAGNCEDARCVAERIGIPFYLFEFVNDFDTSVVRRFVDCYRRGGTPNPCIDCNRYLKFGALYHRVSELGWDTLVTGHYARIESDSSGRPLLKKGLDEQKDQSYVLYSLTPSQLRHIRFPLGALRKSEVREIAEAQGFLNAHKHDSQDICFVPDGKYAAFIDRYTGESDRTGYFVDLRGNILGQHKGFCRYTIGQRKKLGIPLSEPLTVCAKNTDDSSILLAPDERVYSDRLIAVEFNWSALDRPVFPLRCTAKIRYKAPEAPAIAVGYTDDGGLELRFDEPLRAITPGQSVVLYDGDILLGGGIIR